ncbi:hypothetical protein INS49_003320 [Diaporthe citri]|uniref:uncharacterized protein n=1 Tax=Diaporthe citri TaxID=83186 RepID=UPI001C81E39F|nr:uncharacterized protein INS49_003320 [Diaporthe citri]KAG6355358.1 hypothetical protein INS49_003320 [Diaporthe citri]
MSAPNIDSLAGQGEFHSKKPGAEPLTHGGHKPGVKVGNDAAPEFSTEAHEPGTAPSKDAFQPNPESEVPGQAQNNVATTQTDALGSLPGATSGSVHNATQFGKPAQGESSAEAHSDKTERRTGVEGHLQYGQSAETGDGSVEGKARAIGADLEGRAGELEGQKGASGAAEGGVNWPGAESAEPVSAEALASERR